MSYDQSLPPQGPAQLGRKPGMSTGGKVLLILGVIGGGMALLCCGGIVAITMYARHYMGEATSDDPTVVVAKTEEIAHIEIPAELAPAAIVDMKIPISGQPFMKMVIYGDKATQSVLVLSEMGEGLGGNSQAQMRQSMEQSLRQQGFGQQGNFVTEKSTVEQIQVRGQPTPFQVIHGKDSRTGARLQVTGTFEGNGGPVLVVVNVDAEKFPEDRIVEMLESIE